MITVQYESKGLNLDEYPPVGTWSEWVPYAMDLATWFRVQLRANNGTNMIVEVRLPGTSTQLRCFLHGHTLYSDDIEKQPEYLGRVFEALNQVIPGISRKELTLNA